MFNYIIKNFYRYLLSCFSFYYQNDIKKYKIISSIAKIKIKNYLLKNAQIKNVTKTHAVFNEKVLELLKHSRLISFLRFSFIQQMFFVHNRFFIYKELKELQRSKIYWPLYKKLIVEEDAGDPVRYFLYPKSSGNRINHVYHLSILQKFLKIDLKKIDHVFEFGGGYGCMASIFFNLNNKINYRIYDTFYTNLLQYYYLKILNFNPILDYKSNHSLLLMNNINQLKKFNNEKINNLLFIANWSLSEVSLKFREKFQKTILKSNYIIISFQEVFEDINNIEYFYNLKKKLKYRYKVQIIKNKFYKGHFFSRHNHYFFLAKINKL